MVIFITTDTREHTVLSKIKGTILTATYPIQWIFSSISEFTTDTVQTFKTKSELLEQNKELKKKIDLLEMEIIESKNLEIENAKLKNLLNFITDLNIKKYKYITGKVIGYSGDNWINSLIINLGSKDGIKEGDIVVADGYFAGVISEVGIFSSTVLLVSNRNFYLTVRTRKTREIAYFQGIDLKNGILKYVKPEQDIRIGDVVETAGINGFPAGIPIGQIKEVSYEEGNFFQDIKVKLFLYPYNLEYVVVLKKSENLKKDEHKRN